MKLISEVANQAYILFLKEVSGHYVQAIWPESRFGSIYVAPSQVQVSSFKNIARHFKVNYHTIDYWLYCSLSKINFLHDNNIN